MENGFPHHYSHFEYQVMPFGLSNAPASFQSYINKILAEKFDIFVNVYLDDILIYTKDQGQGHVEAMQWVLDCLWQNSLFANLKKCCFHRDEVRFLGYVVSAQGIRMEDKQIEAVKNCPEPKSVQDIQVFIGFVNFYERFIQDFSRVAAPLTSMLKTTGSSGSAPSMLEAEDEVVGGDGGRADEMARNLSKSKKSKNEKSEIPTCTNIRVTGKPTFLTPNVREAFNQLRQAFTKAPIFRHIDPKCHIWIETNAFGYVISGVLSQLTSDQVTFDQVTSGSKLNSAKSKVSTKFDSNQWYPVAYFSRKMMPAEIQYKTQNAELLAIVEAFKTWKHYLEDCKHEVLVLIEHNNFRGFINIKSLSSRQVWCAQELCRYHFRIDYCQGKANGAADALSCFPQQSPAKKDELKAENTRILHKLQSSLTSTSLLGLSISTELLPLH